MAPLRWSMSQQALRRHALMDHMMDVTGVEPITAIRTGDGFVTARAKCRNCPHETGCRAWILEGGGAEPPEFCANAEFFRACKQDKD